MARLLFVLHGMGHHPVGWDAGPLGVLREAADRYGVGDRLAAEVRVEALSYDDVFRRHLAGWDRSESQLREALEQGGSGGFTLPGWLEGVSETEKNFFWSHVVDVLLYRFFPAVATEVRTRVMEAFVERVNAATPAAGPPPRVAILAHSLGTAVAHDALAYLTTTEIDGSRAYLAEAGWRLDHLFMVANVSRVLARLTTPFYHSSVRCEGAPGVGVAAVREYLSFRHALDPVPSVKAFQPAGWGPRYHAAENLEHLLEWNVHAFEHYLRHPDVHVPVLNRLLDYPVTEVQHREAVAELEEVAADTCAEVLQRLRTRLRQARDLVASAAEQPEAVIKVATQVCALAQTAREECAAATDDDD